MRPERFLDAAVAAARHALRDREPDDVPAALRRVVAYSGGTLPPPFARSLLTWLHSDEVLRGEALEVWDGETPSVGPRRASYVFLERGDGWLDELMALAHEMGAQEGSHGDRRLEVERDALAAEVAAHKQRNSEARARVEELESELRRSERQRRAPARAERASEARLERELMEARAEADRLRRELESVRSDSAARLAELQEEIVRQRKERAAAVSAAAGSGEAPVPAGGAELGRLLDRIASATGMAATVSIAPPAGDADPGPLRLPSTVRPDGAAAIEWVRSLTGVSVVIDGYNLGFALAGLEPPMARLRVEEVVRRLGITSPSSVTVVFDSAVDADAEPSASRSVALRFSGGRTADDVIVELAARPRSVVISDDREVRERSEEVGAVALWSKAVLEWSRQR